ncbi:MAG: hypothetical protein LH615_00850 [Ferruginibacter sp.]|nr:hypothetical protein [Ferruginibacter sp.]
MMVILFLLIVFIGASYFIAFVKGKRVINGKLLKVRNQKTGVVLSTMESSKYISDYDLQVVNDSTASISVYTTSIYNLFANKVSEISITLDDRVKKLIVVGKVIERDSLLSDR